MFHQRIAERLKRRLLSPGKLRPQLEMVRLNLEDLPEIVVPEGYALRTYLPGDEIAWCRIMEGNVGRDWTEEKWKRLILQDARFDPGNLFLATHAGLPVASGLAWRLDTGDPEVGVFHMIAVLEAHRGKGLGHMLNAAILHRLRTLQFRKVRLATDDFRIPAIKSYLKVGFLPFYTHRNHRRRWKRILRQLGIPGPSVAQE